MFKTGLITAAALGLALAGATTASAQMAPGYGYGYGYGQQGPGYGPMMPYWGNPWGYGPGPQAAPPAGAPRMGMRNPNAPGRGRFAMVDANEDGTVSAEEAASHADMVFTAMDADDDGQLTLEEYMEIRMGPQEGLNPDREAAMQARKEARFAPMDSDGDGKVSKEEFMAQAEAHFGEAGRNGAVTPWSYRRRNWN